MRDALEQEHSNAATTQKNDGNDGD